MKDIQKTVRKYIADQILFEMGRQNFFKQLWEQANLDDDSPHDDQLPQIYKVIRKVAKQINNGRNK